VLTSLTYALAYIQPLLLIAAVLLILSSGFCDTLDGILARTYDQATAFGGFFDSLLDRYADSAIYTGIIIGGLCDPLAGLVALAGSLLVSYSRARAEGIGIKMESIGLAERAERMLILVGATIFAFFWLPSLNIGIIILAILSNLTVIQRAYYVYKTLKNKEKS
jgi:archaetidylinositol phosphate synthase